MMPCSDREELLLWQTDEYRPERTVRAVDVAPTSRARTETGSSTG
jgi:hypothetical protein